MHSSVDLRLPRPQYVSVPEGFISALASRCYVVDFAGLAGDEVPAAVYEANPQGRRPKRPPHQTRPYGQSVEDFAAELETAGLISYNGQKELARAVASGIAGVRTRAWRGRAAIPMSIGLALAQNVRGLAGTKNPPDLAAILDRFFAMGAPEGADGQFGASETWARAAARRARIDPLVGMIDTALSEIVFVSGYEPRPDAICPIHRVVDRSDTTGSVLGEDEVKSCLRIHGSNGNFQGTPFSWFYDTWTKLCSDVWVEALPARVWVDWASTVLRLAFGMGYLWEVSWYESIAQSVIQNDDRTSDQLARSIGALLPWRDSASSVSVRDVAAATRWRVMRSHDVRTCVQDWTKRHDLSTADEQLVAMRSDPTLRRDLGRALAEGGSTNANLWEAINYSLLTRVGTGEDTDHYGLLRKHGPRYTVPDPGVEWLAAIASLSCPGPSQSTNVATLMANLRAMGLRPDRGDLVRRLEEAGVARGSADADQAVEIKAAF